MGKNPYPGIEGGKVHEMLLKNYRMPKPDYAPNEMYKIMLDCWSIEQMNRPSFRDLTEVIGDLLGEGEREHYLVLSQQAKHDKTSGLLERMAAADYKVGDERN